VIGPKPSIHPVRLGFTELGRRRKVVINLTCTQGGKLLWFACLYE